jgi:uncharacterized membrane protein YqaE (UPF0057 family)
MIRLLVEKIWISLVNIFCPPLAVFLIAGPGRDVVFNCFLFALAVIPSHFHSFYITSVYFYRKRKVRKGLPPGGRKPLIWSARVLNGGANAREVRRLEHTLQPGEQQRERGNNTKKTKRNQRSRRFWRTHGDSPNPEMAQSGNPTVQDWLKDQDSIDDWDEQHVSESEYGTDQGHLSPVRSRNSPTQNSLRYSPSNSSPIDDGVSSTRPRGSQRSSFHQNRRRVSRRQSQIPEIDEERPPLPARTQSQTINPQATEWTSVTMESQK